MDNTSETNASENLVWKTHVSISPPAPKTIVLVSANVGQNFGGEAIKAWQYAKYLRAAGYGILIIAHERSRSEVEAEFAPEAYRLIPDDWLTVLMWKTPFRVFMNFYFHWLVRRSLMRENLDPSTHILHYIAPISPVAVRLPLPNFHTVIGPLSGNIYYPPAFKARMSRKDKLRDSLHGVTQRLMGAVFGDKRRANALLVSGYERTYDSLKIAGCQQEQFIDVVDSGVNEAFAGEPRIQHPGENRRFFCIGRLIDYKGYDLAIKALAKAHPDTCLDIYGNGDKRRELEKLTADLGLSDRVTFHGWVANDKLISLYANYRAYIFPSLAEANGIVMQEAMMLGTPVITLRWGGPAMLADDQSAIYIEPKSEDHVVTGIAHAMDRLAIDDAFAEELSLNARSIAEARFTWDAVAASWEKAYPSDA